MAAVYLHDTKHTQGLPETTTTVEHFRQLSTLSSATLHTSTTSHSHPNDPLLPPPLTAGADEATLAYYEQLSHQPRNPDGSPAHLRWDNLPTLQTNPSANLNEKGRVSNQSRRKPWRRRRRVKYALQMVLGKWILLL